MLNSLTRGKIYFYICGFIVLIFGLIMVVGCKNTTENIYYKTFTTPDGEYIRFSFEYPGNYSYNYAPSMSLTSGIEILKYSPNQPHLNPFIRIEIQPVGSYWPNNPADALTYYFSSMAHPLDFQKLNNDSITIDNIQADSAEYSFQSILEGRSINMIGKIIIFNHNSSTWEISMTYNSQSVKTVKPEIDHILQTFKILN